MTRISAVALLFVGGLAHATVTAADFTETIFVQDPELDGATGLAWAPDGTNRLFVIRKGGQVMVIKDGTLLAEPFATIEPIYTINECGLVGMAFDPAFAVTQQVYFFVTVASDEQQIIRYTANGDVGVDKTPILTGLPTAGANHDGGALAIGPDGHIYWAIGDLGAGAGVDDDLTTLAAKVGRARLDGEAPLDNPFHDGDGPNNDYIWARGFRNPFTMTFEPGTGRLWLNVVGSGHEQIFVVGRGDHAGWNDYENDQPAGFIRPAFAYPTNGTEMGGCVTGGCFYDGTAFPVAYRGNFFFGDYNSGRLMRAPVDGAGTLGTVEYFATEISDIVDVTTGPDGALYYASVTNRTIFRTAYTGVDLEPDAGAEPLPDAGATEIPDGAANPAGGGLGGGCGCRLARGSRPSTVAWLLVAVVGLGAARRRRGARQYTTSTRERSGVVNHQ